MEEEENKIDYLGTEAVTIFTTAFVGDFLFILILPHYVAGLMAYGVLWPKTKGILAKIVLAIAFIIPLPLLFLGAFFAILLSNKIIARIAEQALVVAFAASTGGAGAAAEGAVTAGAAAEAGAAATEAGVAGAEAGAEAATAAEAAEGAEVAAEAGEAGEVAVTEGGEGALAEGEEVGTEEGANEIEPEALGQERELLGEEGQLEKELLEETPEPEAASEVPEESRKERTLREDIENAKRKVEDIRKAKERLERILPKQEEQETQPEEEIEEEEEAA